MNDQFVREIVTSGENPQSYLLTAGAGAGKTSVLVDRISNLILSGVQPEKIVAITFTEKAAGELSRRVKKKLFQLTRTHQSDVQLKELRKMFTGTIHSFALRLLQRAPITSNIEPIPTIIEDEQIAIRLKQVQKKWLQKHSEVIANAIMSGIINRNNIYNILRLVVSLNQVKINVTSQFITDEEITSSIEKIQNELKRYLQLCDASSDKLREWMDRTIQELEALRDIKTLSNEQKLFQITSLLQRINFNEQEQTVKIKNYGTKKNWKGSIDLIREKSISLIKEIAKIRSSLLSKELKKWEELLTDFHQTFHNTLRELGEVRFDDIISNAIEITHQKINHPYQYYHLDEAQDTDPRLLQLIENLLKSKNDSAVIFIVGDVNQSIYSFRDANVNLFRDTMTKLVIDLNPNNAKQTLVSNFRSTPKIVNFINTLFKSKWHNDYVEMVAENTAISNDIDQNDSAVTLFEIDESTEVTNIDKAHRIAAEIVANYIHARSQVQPTTLPKNKDGTIAWSQIAVLFPATNHLKKYTEAFRRYGLPFVEEQATGFYDNEIIQEIANVIQLIANPKDGVALLAVLRGRFFGVTDRAIWEWRNLLEKTEEGNPLYESMYLTRPMDGLDEQLKFALNTLYDLHLKKDCVSPFNLIIELFHKSGIYHLTFKEADVALREKLNSVLTILRKHKTRSLNELADRLRNSIQEQERVKGISASEEQAIRFLTVHSAKGLEFDWVIVVGAADKGGRDQITINEVLIKNEDGTIECKFNPWFETENYRNRKKQLKAIQDEENFRVLYVAMTRARNKLLLPLITSTKLKSANQDWIDLIKQAASLVPHEIINKNLCERTPISSIKLDNEEAILFPKEGNVNEFHISTVTKWIDEHFQSGSKQVQHKALELDPIQLGILAHLFIQVASPFDTEDQLEMKFREVVTLRRLEIEETKFMKQHIFEWLRKWYESDFYQQIKDRQHIYEYPITYRQGNQLILGSVDLLIVNSDHWIVLDFKTNVTLEPFIDKYQEQIRLYCEAIQRATQIATKGYLWHFPQAQLISIFPKET
ncbi:MAG: UvrD-helicase domain-containing protein [bacterium]|nr:UvrD-helicase domain-containing protein [bacterium]